MPNTYTKLASSTLSTTTTILEFDNINSSYRNLIMSVYCRSNRASNYQDILELRFNDNANAIYSTQYFYLQSTLPDAGRSSLNTAQRSGYFIPATSVTDSSIFSSFWLTIPSYSTNNGNLDKRSLFFGGFTNSTSSTGQFGAGMGGSRTGASVPITKIRFTNVFGSFVSGSIFTLYGID